MFSLMGALFLEQRLDGGDKWWSGFSFTTSKTTDLGGVAQWGFGLTTLCIEIATDVARMVASDYLMYYFVRSL